MDVKTITLHTPAHTAALFQWDPCTDDFPAQHEVERMARALATWTVVLWICS